MVPGERGKFIPIYAGADGENSWRPSQGAVHNTFAHVWPRLADGHGIFFLLECSHPVIPSETYIIGHGLEAIGRTTKNMIYASWSECIYFATDVRRLKGQLCHCITLCIPLYVPHQWQTFRVTSHLSVNIQDL
jgi:hypothetical protein